MRSRSSLALCLCVLSAACVGTIGDRDRDDAPPASSSNPETPPTAEELTAKSGLRRLTSHEYDQVLSDVLLDESAPSSVLLPEDVRMPFDNDYTTQIASAALIQGAELLASDAAARLLADPVKRDKVVGCKPTGPGDAACFQHFIETFGRLALRHPLAGDEVAKFMALQASGVAAGDFWVGIDTAIRAFLQHPELLYRVEIGEPVDGAPGVFRLDDWEVATRLSFLLWSTTPDAWLLDLAGAGNLHDAEGIRAAATQMLDDPRARRTVDRFHALWMGFEQIPLSADLATAMQDETNALLERVIFEDQAPWQDIFSADETFVTDALAEHYGLGPPGSTKPVWTPYGSSGRQGILSHGSFLSAAAKFDDTSPTMRGLLIRTRLFCQAIPPPPPNVATDDPIPETEDAVCKVDRYAAHRQGGCKSCHDLMDPVGFGLENYDREGKYRTHDIGHPECVIDGKGELAGVGTFQGPAGLADLMVSSGVLDECVATQLYRFAVGRTQLDPTDQELVKMLVESGGQSFRFTDLLLELVSSETFVLRREE